MARSVPDTLLAHTLIRAALVWGGAEEGQGRWGTAYRLARVTPRAARVVAFVVLWAITMDELGIGDGELSPEVYAVQGNESRATTYRRLHEYAELWPDVDINDLGRAVLAAAAKLRTAPSSDTIVRLPRPAAAAA